MNKLYLVRHGEHDLLGRILTGRTVEAPLNAKGEGQAAAAANWLQKAGITSIYSSPLQRCRQTAEPLATATGLAVQIREEINEFECGDWAGLSFSDMEGLPGWQAFNQFRSGCRPPGGESMLDVQARMVRFAQGLPDTDGAYAIFSHGDPIKALLMHFLGMPIDLFSRIEVSPGSISLLRLGSDWAQIQLLNLTP